MLSSDRPRNADGGHLCLNRLGWENSLGFSPYNNRFRTYRKNMARIIGSKSLASQFNTLQEAEVGHFLLHLLERPEKLVEHIRKSVLHFVRRCDGCGAVC